MNAQNTPYADVVVCSSSCRTECTYSKANANESAAIFIDPLSIKSWDYAPQTEFTISVFVANVSDLSVVAFSISHKPFIFSYRSLSLGALSHAPKPKWQVDDEKGFFG